MESLRGIADFPVNKGKLISPMKRLIEKANFENNFANDKDGVSFKKHRSYQKHMPEHVSKLRKVCKCFIFSISWHISDFA